MKILTISGSARSDSANVRLLTSLPNLFREHTFQHYKGIENLPLFRADLDQHPWTEAVLDWRQALQQSDAVIITTPEYIHNLPALIKNALEWVTSSGAFFQKRVLAITFTPNAPRGEKAMQSLLWSLQALEANVVLQLPLYQNEMEFDKENNLIKNDAVSMLAEALQILIT